MSEKAQFNYPVSVAVGRDGAVYVADQSNQRIRKIQGNTVSTIAGTGDTGYRDGLAAQAQFDDPYGVAVGPDGAVYVADSGNHCIRVIKGDQVSTLAGTVTRGMIDSASGVPLFRNPNALAVASDGTVYVADCNNHRIRKIQGKWVSSVAGCDTLTEGYRDGEAADAKFRYPYGIAVGPDNTLYVADTVNHRIRKIKHGQVSKVAGTGTEGFRDGAAASEARFCFPYDVAVGPDGTLYVADSHNNRIRKIEDNEVSTFAGTGAEGFVDGPAANAQLNQPYGVAVGPDGTVYFADQRNHCIRLIRNNQVSTLAGTGTKGFADGAAV